MPASTHRKHRRVHQQRVARLVSFRRPALARLQPLPTLKPSTPTLTAFRHICSASSVLMPALSSALISTISFVVSPEGACTATEMAVSSGFSMVTKISCCRTTAALNALCIPAPCELDFDQHFQPFPFSYHSPPINLMGRLVERRRIDRYARAQPTRPSVTPIAIPTMQLAASQEMPSPFSDMFFPHECLDEAARIPVWATDWNDQAASPAIGLTRKWGATR